MNDEVPYMSSIKNLTAILDKITQGSVPNAFGIDFLRDLGFKSSNDRSILKLLRFLDMIDGSGRPTENYRNFVNPSQSRAVLARCIRRAYDDLFISNQNAPGMSRSDLAGWFKTKTGKSNAVSDKIATTFRALAEYADFTAEADSDGPMSGGVNASSFNTDEESQQDRTPQERTLGMTYRIEVVLPETTNVDTYRAIFRALREELHL